MMTDHYENSVNTQRNKTPSMRSHSGGKDPEKVQDFGIGGGNTKSIIIKCFKTYLFEKESGITHINEQYKN